MKTDCPYPLHAWPSEKPIPLEHPELPEGIRQATLEIWQTGDLLHRIITDQGIEWWLLDERGELIEVFWSE